MLTSFLIFVPVVGGLLVWLLPLRGRAQAGGVALAVALAEVGLWIAAVAGFDFGTAGLQFEAERAWSDTLGIAYKVGLYDFSLWLVGLTVVVMAAAIAYGLRVGRERPRGYFGLMLVLLGATVGVFTAQDLLLFYVFFETMMVPLYFLIGIWGGPARAAATLRFVIYTLVGSLLMLVAIIAFGLTEGTFDLTAIGTSESLFIFLGFALAFAIKAPVWPFHGWLPDAYRQAPPEVAAVLSGLISKTAAYGFLRIAIPSFPDPVDDMRVAVLALATAGLVYGSLIAFRQPDFRGVVAYSSLAQMSLITVGLFAANDSGISGALLHMVSHGLVSAVLFFLAGLIELRTGTGRFDELGGMARGRPILAAVLITAGVIALAVPGSSAFAGEFLMLNGVFAVGWGWAIAGGVAVILAALYMLRLISAVLHDRQGPSVRSRVADLRSTELAFVGPLVVLLIALSFWPGAVTDHSFGGEPSTAVTSRFEP